MFVWSKKLIASLLALFLVLLGVFLIHGAPDSASGLKFTHLVDGAQLHRTHGLGLCLDD